MVELPPVKRKDAGSNPVAGANHGGVSEKADALQAAAGRFDSGRLHHSMTTVFQAGFAGLKDPSELMPENRRFSRRNDYNPQGF